MHILYLCDEFPPYSHGGIGTFTYTMAHAIRQRGHDVTIAGLYNDLHHTITEDDKGIRVIRLAATKLPKLRAFVDRPRLGAMIRRLHQEQPIDLIEGPENSFGLLALTGQLPSPRLIRLHGGHHFFYSTLNMKPRPIRSFIERQSFRQATHYAAVTAYVAEITRQLLRLDNAPIEIIYNYVDIHRFKPQSDIPTQPGLIVFAGTLTEKKGVRQLVEAMSQVVEAVPHAQLRLIGRDRIDPGYDKPFSQVLRERIPPDLQDKIEFYGPVNNAEIPQHYAQAEVLIFPSHMESFGLVYVEAMAMQKPTIISKLGPGPEIMTHDVHGLLCDPYDPSDIAAQLIRMLQDKDLQQRLAVNARKRAEEKFALQKLADDNEAFYKRLIDQYRQSTTI